MLYARIQKMKKDESIKNVTLHFEAQIRELKLR